MSDKIYLKNGKHYYDLIVDEEGDIHVIVKNKREKIVTYLVGICNETNTLIRHHHINNELGFNLNRNRQITDYEELSTSSERGAPKEESETSLKECTILGPKPSKLLRWKLILNYFVIFRR